MPDLHVGRSRSVPRPSFRLIPERAQTLVSVGPGAYKTLILVDPGACQNLILVAPEAQTFILVDKKASGPGLPDFLSVGFSKRKHSQNSWIFRK